MQNLDAYNFIDCNNLNSFYDKIFYAKPPTGPKRTSFFFSTGDYYFILN